MLKRILKNLIKWIQSEENSGSPSQNIQLIQSASIYLFDKKKNITSSSFAEQFKEGDYEKALEKAWHNRDFEIEMYWKRASYFWTFIGATLVGYFALIGSKGFHDNLKYEYYQIEVFIITIGFLFSEAWYFVNKGSKRWQENWEAQIDELEKLLGRPNYTTIFYRPGYYSVSRINEKVSLLISRIWLILYSVYWVRYYDCYYPLGQLHVKTIALNAFSFLTIVVILWFMWYLRKKAESGINDEARIIQTNKSDVGNKFFFSRVTKEGK